MARIQVGTSSQASDAERALLTEIHAAPVFSEGSLIRMASLKAPAGHACEFGVWKGRTLAQIRCFRKPWVFGFDSWQGLPEAWDTGGGREHQAGHFACDPPKDLGHGVKLVPGWFADTIPAWLAKYDGPVQMLHIDCDLYSSSRDVLFGLNDRIEANAVILFDELIDFAGTWYPNWRDGEWRALNEWLAECGRVVIPIGRTANQQAAFVVEV